MIIIIICVFVFGGKESKPAQETPTVPITGLSDTSNKQAQGDSESTSNSDSQTQQSSVAPTKATFTYKVASGSRVYIEIYEGDSSSASVAETVTGPAEKSFDVTTKLRFISDASSAVEVTVDGEKVDLTENSNGMYDYTVDFSQILAKWHQDHGQASSSSSATSSDSAKSTSTSSSSSTKSTTSSSSSNATSTKSTTRTSE